jgi:hypothetical protein
MLTNNNMASLRYRKTLRNVIDNYTERHIEIINKKRQPKEPTCSVKSDTVKDLSGEIFLTVTTKCEKRVEEKKQTMPSINQIKYKINNIVEIVTDKINTTTIIDSINTMRAGMKTYEDIIRLINTISNGLIINKLDTLQPEFYAALKLQIDSFKSDLLKYDTIEDDCVIYHQARIYDILEKFNTIVNDCNYMNDLQNNLKDIQTIIAKNTLSIQVIRQAEFITLNIIQNITDQVDYNFIYRRIEYLAYILKSIDSSCIFYDKKIGDVMLCIIDMITNKKDLKEITEYVTCINEVMKKNVALIDMLQRCEFIIMGIIQNITDQVDTNFIIGRINYLKRLIVAFENSN